MLTSMLLTDVGEEMWKGHISDAFSWKGQLKVLSWKVFDAVLKYVSFWVCAHQTFKQMMSVLWVIHHESFFCSSVAVELMTYHSTVGVFILVVCRNHFYHSDWVKLELILEQKETKSL